MLFFKLSDKIKCKIWKYIYFSNLYTKIKKQFINYFLKFLYKKKFQHSLPDFLCFIIFKNN